MPPGLSTLLRSTLYGTHYVTISIIENEIDTLEARRRAVLGHVIGSGRSRAVCAACLLGVSSPHSTFQRAREVREIWGDIARGRRLVLSADIERRLVCRRERAR